MKFKEVITRGDGKPYMERYQLFKCRWFRIYLHHFISSDDLCLHDHPLSFITFILKGSYIEETFDGKIWNPIGNVNLNQSFKRKKIKTFSIHYRPATWTHRVVIDKPCWTLFIGFKYKRQWGFWTKFGWFPYNIYSSSKHCPKD